MPEGLAPAGDLRSQLERAVGAIDAELVAISDAREAALPACRRVVRASGSAIRAVHRHELADAERLTADAEVALREAQRVLEPFPVIAHAGFLHDAEKEYVEARCTAALVAGDALPGPTELAVGPQAWLRGLAEAASELRRHALDRLRAGDLEGAEALLGAMEDVCDALMEVDHPDAVTNGLRRTVDALRAVLERTRGDVTTTAVQARLQQALERR